MYKRILVATGGSPWSDAAVAYAIRLAAGTGAEVCILSVLTISVSYDTPEAGMEFDMLIDSVEQEGKERLLRAATRQTRGTRPGAYAPAARRSSVTYGSTCSQVKPSPSVRPKWPYAAVRR